MWGFFLGMGVKGFLELELLFREREKVVYFFCCYVCMFVVGFDFWEIDCILCLNLFVCFLNFRFLVLSGGFFFGNFEFFEKVILL